MKTAFINQDQSVSFSVASATLKGIAHVPESAEQLVLFVHGSGSSHLSPRNQFVAKSLQKLGIATFLFDLLTADEDVIDETTRAYRFNIDFLTERLVNATSWALDNLGHFHLGYFGASTGAAAALKAAALLPQKIQAVVSRGGRPDLAGEALPKVRAATLLIVGGHDEVVIDLNQEAYEKLTAQKSLVIVPAATHLFEEPGKLEIVTEHAGAWFKQYLR